MTCGGRSEAADVYGGDIADLFRRDAPDYVNRKAGFSFRAGPSSWSISKSARQSASPSRKPSCSALTN
jgi:hypothetical protein